jgi:hypothetical protein
MVDGGREEGGWNEAEMVAGVRREGEHRALALWLASVAWALAECEWRFGRDRALTKQVFYE